MMVRVSPSGIVFGMVAISITIASIVSAQTTSFRNLSPRLPRQRQPRGYVVPHDPNDCPTKSGTGDDDGGFNQAGSYRMLKSQPVYTTSERRVYKTTHRSKRRRRVSNPTPVPKRSMNVKTYGFRNRNYTPVRSKGQYLSIPSHKKPISTTIKRRSRINYVGFKQHQKPIRRKQMRKTYIAFKKTQRRHAPVKRVQSTYNNVGSKRVQKPFHPQSYRTRFRQPPPQKLSYHTTDFQQPPPQKFSYRTTDFQQPPPPPPPQVPWFNGQYSAGIPPRNPNVPPRECATPNPPVAPSAKSPVPTANATTKPPVAPSSKTPPSNSTAPPSPNATTPAPPNTTTKPPVLNSNMTPSPNTTVVPTANAPVPTLR